LASVCVSGAGTSANEFWTCGTQGTVLHSADGGASWSIDAPTPPPGGLFNWRGIAFSSLNDGIVVGTLTQGSTTVGAAYRRSVSGWTSVAITDAGGTPLTNALNAVHVSGSSAVAVGPGGAVFTFISGALRLHAVASGLTTKELFSVRLVPNGATSDVFVGGADGAFIRRTGGTWSALRSKTNGDISALWFRDPAHGYVMAKGGNMIGANSCLLEWR
jgi:photosystem II stability/assembly factor-like uncharacterized protein